MTIYRYVVMATLHVCYQCLNLSVWLALSSSPASSHSPSLHTHLQFDIQYEGLLGIGAENIYKIDREEMEVRPFTSCVYSHPLTIHLFNYVHLLV